MTDRVQKLIEAHGREWVVDLVEETSSRGMDWVEVIHANAVSFYAPDVKSQENVYKVSELIDGVYAFDSKLRELDEQKYGELKKAFEVVAIETQWFKDNAEQNKSWFFYFESGSYKNEVVQAMFEVFQSIKGGAE